MNAIQDTIEQSLQKTLESQKLAYLDEGYVSYETRIDRLDRALKHLLKYQDELCAALGRLLEDPELGRKFVAAGLARRARFDRQATFSEVEAVLERVSGARGSA